MNCSELSGKIEACFPEAQPLEVARVCTLIFSCLGDDLELDSEEELEEVWETINLRLHAASDQHAAVTTEMESLASSDPLEFDAEKVWVLLRAIKIQSQILRMYVGDPALEIG